ncbi:MAG TPA: hypothetical protein VG435_01685, partial [Acidimicrobiales bacterium]|nr:hypothetical protein [Acidimicrobiales bacterium]
DRATNPAVNTFLNYLPKARASATPDQFAVDSWTAGELLLQAMTNAGSTISPTSVLSALSKVTDFNADGLIGTTHPGVKGGTTCVVMANVQNEQWVRVHPTGTGFDCSGTYHNVPLSSLNS